MKLQLCYPIPESTPSVARWCVFWGKAVLWAYFLIAIAGCVFYLIGELKAADVGLAIAISGSFVLDYAQRYFREAALHKKVMGLKKSIKELTEKHDGKVDR